MEPAAAEAGITLRIDVPPEPVFVSANEYALGRVYRNLVQNALQATEPGGTVTVSTEQHDGRVRVRVADTGIGIPADRLHTIFEDYVTTKKRGLGLGLAISRRLVEQLDGTIGVESSVGKGTVFTIEFPLQTVTA
jgi:signal transduction histidine kinase